MNDDDNDDDDDDDDDHIRATQIKGEIWWEDSMKMEIDVDSNYEEREESQLGNGG